MSESERFFTGLALRRQVGGEEYVHATSAVAVLTVINRPAELRTRVLAALRHGCTMFEFREVLLLAGLRAAADGFAQARTVPDANIALCHDNGDVRSGQSTILRGTAATA